MILSNSYIGRITRNRTQQPHGDAEQKELFLHRPYQRLRMRAKGRLKEAVQTGSTNAVPRRKWLRQYNNEPNITPDEAVNTARKNPPHE